MVSGILVLIVVLLFIVAVFFAVAGFGMLVWNLMSIGITFIVPIDFWTSCAMLMVTLVIIFVIALLSE